MKCPKCGREVSIEDRFCSSCGAYLRKNEDVAYGKTSVVRARPLGVAALAALSAIEGIVILSLGLTDFSLLKTSSLIPFWSFLASAEGVIKGVSVLMGAIDVTVALGFLKGSSWSWTVGFALAVIRLIMGPFMVIIMGPIYVILVPFYFAFNMAVMKYLLSPHVKRFFGEET